jgi:excisionase family DNA binding protein
VLLLILSEAANRSKHVLLLIPIAKPLHKHYVMRRKLNAKSGQLLVDRVYRIRSDLDRSAEMAAQFLLAAPQPMSVAPVPEGSYDLSRAAQYLNVGVPKLRKLCREHRISHARPDYRTYIFKRSDLDEFLSRFRIQRKSAYD